MNSKWLAITIIFFSIFAGVNALSINGANSLSLCQCDTNSLVYSVCADTAGTYNVSISGLGSKWVKLAPSTLNLSAGECSDVFVFVTPECYAISGSFPFEIVVNGVNDYESKQVSLFVEQCHTFNFDVTPTTNTSLPCELNEFNVRITNTGKFADEFVLLQNNLIDSWVKYPRNSFVLNAGETLNTKLIVESDCSTLPNSYPFDLKLSNTKTNASNTKNLVQIIQNFVPITHDISSSVSMCAEEGKEFVITLTNISSKEDTINISVTGENFISVDKKSLVLAPQESKSFKLIINPSSPQETNFILSLYSKNYDNTYNTSITAVLKDCYNISLQKSSSQTNFCVGENTQTFNVFNNGTQEVEVIVSISGLNAETKTVIVAPSSNQEVSLSFIEDEGVKNIVVLAQTKYSEDRLEYEIVFENCFGAELLVPSVAVCSNDPRNIELLLKNNGSRQQEFNISVNANWINVREPTMVLAPNSEQLIVLELNTPSEIADDYLITVISDNTTINRTLPIELIAQEDCYAFDTKKTSEVIDINCCDGAITELLIKNNGYFSQTIDLEKIAPEWVTFSHSRIVLNPSEEKVVYVYFSPPAGTHGEIIGSVKLTNQKGFTKTVDFNLRVFGGYCGLGINADLGVDGEITLTKIFTRKEIDVEFSIFNDSNVGFNIVDITVDEYPGAEVKFERNIFLEPQVSTKARMTIGFLENQEPEDREVTLTILTSVGEFKKKQLVNFSDANKGLIYNEVAITGFFAQFVAPIAGLLLLLLILVVIVFVLNKKDSGDDKPKNAKKPIKQAKK